MKIGGRLGGPVKVGGRLGGLVKIGGGSAGSSRSAARLVGLVKIGRRLVGLVKIGWRLVGLVKIGSRLVGLVKIGSRLVELDRSVAAGSRIGFRRDARRRCVDVVGFGFEFGELVAFIAGRFERFTVQPAQPVRRGSRWPIRNVGEPYGGMVIGVFQPQRLGLGGGVMGGVDVERALQRPTSSPPRLRSVAAHQSHQHQQRTLMRATTTMTA